MTMTHSEAGTEGVDQAKGQSTPVIRVRDLKVSFRGRSAGDIRAVDGVSFDVCEHETLALVGESGCGKTTIGRTVLALERPTAGSIEFAGRDLNRLSTRELRRQRREFQYIPQDPYASLNPHMSVESIITEPLRVHRAASSKERWQRASELLRMVGLSDGFLQSHPHQLSGGQRQRVSVARAMALEPRLIVCDEPTSSLDVSVRAQISELFRDLQRRTGVAYLFISHDLTSVHSLAHRVAVVYAGKIVELRERSSFFDAPLHPYALALISAVPIPDPVRERTRERLRVTGEPPSPVAPPSGCRFHPRCPFATTRCSVEEPLLETVPGGLVACHYWNEIAVGDHRPGTEVE